MNDDKLIVTSSTPLFLPPAGMVVTVDLASGAVRDRRELDGVAISNAVVVDVEDPTIWYLPSRNQGVLRSEDEGCSWEDASRGLVYREVWSLVQKPSGEMLAGTGPSNVYTSADRGASWVGNTNLLRMPERRTWEFPAPPFHAHVKNLTVAAHAPNLVFGAVEEGHLIRSTDGGITWESVTDGVEFDSHAVCLLPTDPTTVVATSGTGVYRSVDGGDSFTNVTGGIRRRYLARPASHPDRPDEVFVAGAATAPPFWGRPRGACGAIYRSRDQGQTWRQLEGGFPPDYVGAPTVVAIHPDDPDHVVVGMSNGTLWRTLDAGETLSQVAEGLGGIVGVTFT